MKLVEMTIAEFVQVTASDAPAPGGGSVAALAGALGGALAAMVCALTVGRKKYAGYDAETAVARERLTALCERFLDVIDRDTEAFNAVSAVFSLPKETEEQKAARKQAMEEALKGCTKPPFELMELCRQALEQTRALVGRSNASAASDLGVAALNLKASIQSAWLNVLINISGLQDRELAEKYRQDGEALLALALPLADGIYKDILASL